MDIKTLTCRKYDKNGLLHFSKTTGTGTVQVELQQNLVSEIIKIKILLEGLNKKPGVYKCVFEKGFDSNRIPASF